MAARLEIGLEKTDPTFMRPAMRFRGEMETGRIPGVLLVPRDAVFLRDDGPVVSARRPIERPIGQRKRIFSTPRVVRSLTVSAAAICVARQTMR